MIEEKEKIEMEEEEKEEKEEEKKDEPKYITIEDVEKLLNERLPQKATKTRAKRIPESEEEEETDIKDKPTCPKCHGVVMTTDFGWVCYKCNKAYIR